jgi:hypothetical protein
MSMFENPSPETVVQQMANALANDSRSPFPVVPRSIPHFKISSLNPIDSVGERLGLAKGLSNGLF